MRGPGSMAIPRPKIGDVFVKSIDQHGLIRVEGAILCIVGNLDAPIWSGIIMCERGPEPISGTAEPRSELYWRPSEWVKDPQYHCYRPPGLEWDLRLNRWVKTPNDPAVEDTLGDLPAAGAPSQETSGVISPSDLPAPAPDEKFLGWRARALREFPSLSVSKDKELLSAAWRFHKGGAAAA